MSAPRWRAVPPLYGHASWRYVVAHDWAAAVPAETDPAVLSALLELRERRGTTLETLVGVLPLSGEHAITDLVLAELRHEPAPAGTSTVSIIVRGEAAVDVFNAAQSRRLLSRGIQPWLLADFRDVTALSFSEAGARAIRAAELPPPGATASADGDGQWAEQGGAQHGAALRGKRLDLVLGSPGGAGDTGEAGRVAEPARFRVSVAGTAFPLDADSYVGRRPNAPHLDGRAARLVTVDSPGHAVSATHVLLSPAGAHALVTDLDSTNGTLVEMPDGSQRRLQAGIALAVPPGARIVLGDGVVIELLAARVEGSKR